MTTIPVQTNSSSIDTNNAQPLDATRMMTDHNFPSRLYRFLEEVEAYGSSHIASWQPHGRGFRIHKPKLFIKITTAPSWFVYKKYSSFQRQLHIYGFRRISKGEDKNCYYHPYFLRGQYHLISKITRCPVKNGVSLPTTVPIIDTSSSEPDFYSMEPLPSSATTSQHVGGRASSKVETLTDGVRSNDRVKSTPVSEFIQKHLSENRNSIRMNNDTTCSSSKPESAVAVSSTIIPQQPRPVVDSSIFALFERLQHISTKPDITVMVSTQNNNNHHQVSIHVQDPKREMLNVATTDHASQLLLQAEQNRKQFQRLIDQVQLSSSQQQHQLLLSSTRSNPALPPPPQKQQQVLIHAQDPQREMLNVATTDHASQMLQQHEVDIRTKLLLQAEQNREQFQRLINQVHSSSSQQQPQQFSSSFTQNNPPPPPQPPHVQDVIPAPIVRYALQQGAANYWDDVRQNDQVLHAPLSNEQLVRNALARFTSLKTSSQAPQPQPSGVVDVGGHLSSILDVTGRVTPKTTTTTITTSATTTLNDASNNDTKPAAAIVQRLSHEEHARLRFQLWNGV